MAGEGPRRRPVKWKPDEDRSDFGAWLTAQVGERTYDWLADQMEQRGYAHRPDYYRAMAGGSKPGGRIIRAALREFFGAPAEVSRTAPSADLATAVSDLAVELRENRKERQELRDRVEELEALVATLAERLRGAPNALDAPQGSAG